MALEVQSNTLQKVRVKVTPLDDQVPPQPAPVEGGLVVELLQGAATFEIDPLDNLAVRVISEDLAGTSQFRVKVDADLGAGVTEISELINYTYTSPQATSLSLVADPPEPK